MEAVDDRLKAEHPGGIHVAWHCQNLRLRGMSEADLLLYLDAVRSGTSQEFVLSWMRRPR